MVQLQKLFAIRFDVNWYQKEKEGHRKEGKKYANTLDKIFFKIFLLKKHISVTNTHGQISGRTKRYKIRYFFLFFFFASRRLQCFGYLFFFFWF